MPSPPHRITGGRERLEVAKRLAYGRRDISQLESCVSTRWRAARSSRASTQTASLIVEASLLSSSARMSIGANLKLAGLSKALVDPIERMGSVLCLDPVRIAAEFSRDLGSGTG